MRHRGRRSYSLRIGAMAVTLVAAFLLSGCTFWVRMPGGRLAMVTLPDHEVQSFIARMDLLSLKLLQETQRLKDEGLRQVVIETREVYYALIRQMGSGHRTPANPLELQLKVKAFELQLEMRLKTPQQAARYQRLRALFEQLKQEVSRFHSLVERVAH